MTQENPMAIKSLTQSEKWAVLAWAEDHIDKNVAVRLWRDQSRGGLLMAEVRRVEPKHLLAQPILKA
jgi:hypothetical protein